MQKLMRFFNNLLNKICDSYCDELFLRIQIWIKFLNLWEMIWRQSARNFKVNSQKYAKKKI
jgi:hypothetical protein